MLTVRMSKISKHVFKAHVTHMMSILMFFILIFFKTTFFMFVFLTSLTFKF